MLPLEFRLLEILKNPSRLFIHSFFNQVNLSKKFPYNISVQQKKMFVIKKER